LDCRPSCLAFGLLDGVELDLDQSIEGEPGDTEGLAPGPHDGGVDSEGDLPAIVEAGVVPGVVVADDHDRRRVDVVRRQTDSDELVGHLLQYLDDLLLEVAVGLQPAVLDDAYGAGEVEVVTDLHAG